MSFRPHPETVEHEGGPTPRKVVAGYFLSLDGVAEAPDRFFTTWDDDTDAAGARLIATQDTVILGRRTYDEWAGFWPGSEIQPFADFINAVPKYVATSTPLQREWANSRVIDGGLVDLVRHLKTQPGGDIGLHGSISITRTLLAADVVDELRLVIAPTAVGQGERLFDGLPPLRLELIRGTASPSGHLLVDYRVVREPPSSTEVPTSIEVPTSQRIGRERYERGCADHLFSARRAVHRSRPWRRGACGRRRPEGGHHPRLSGVPGARGRSPRPRRRCRR